MVEPKTYSYGTLAKIQAGLGFLIAAIIFGLYALKPGLLANPGTSFTAAIMSMGVVVYYGTIHQLMAAKRPYLSALIMTMLTMLNLALIIAQTGALDSPYYSLWLLAIVTAGLFSAAVTVVILGLTVAAFLTVILLTGGLASPNLSTHLVELAMSLLAGGLAEWIHSRNRHVKIQSVKVEALSGQLAQESLKAQALMGSMGEGVMVVDVQRRVQLFNKAAQQTTGWDEKSAQGIDYNLVLKLRTADDQELTEANDPIAKAWSKHEQVISNDLTLTTQGGRKLAVGLSVSPIYDNNSALTGAIILFRDISEQKAVERQKDEFVSTASHEMRTPVAAIEGYISLAMNPNVATIDDRAKTYLTKAHDAIQHLGELFRDLLNVTKAEEGKLQAKMEAVNLTDLVKTAVDDMQFTAEKKKLSLVFQAASDNPGRAIAPIYYVKANPERLREVVMNLIDNAIKFTAAGGITVTLKGTDKESTVAVADTGVGIAPEDAAHLFQKFYRVDSSATRTIGGTGLGLYLCRTVIELFGGRIWVESKAGQGSTFLFSLPRLTPSQVAALQVQTAAEAAAPPAPAPAPAAPAAAPVVASAPVADGGSAPASNPALTKNAAATVAAALAAHPAKT